MRRTICVLMVLLPFLVLPALGAELSFPQVDELLQEAEGYGVAETDGLGQGGPEHFGDGAGPGGEPAPAQSPDRAEAAGGGPAVRPGGERRAGRKGGRPKGGGGGGGSGGDRPDGERHEYHDRPGPGDDPADGCLCRPPPARHGHPHRRHRRRHRGLRCGRG